MSSGTRLSHARNMIQLVGSLQGKQALVVGGTSGIGAGTALALSKSGASVTIVGRSQQAAEEMLVEMRKIGHKDAVFDFISCDASLISEADKCAKQFAANHNRLDYLVLSQGTSSMGPRQPTSEGIPVKMSIHFYSRMAFANSLLPLLEKTAKAGSDVRVLSVLAPGVHSPYANWKDDPLLENNWSLKACADSTTFYNDLMANSFALTVASPVSFIHINPGFVATNWGGDLWAPLKLLVRVSQSAFARPKEQAGEFMTRALVGPMNNNLSPNSSPGKWFLCDEYGEPTQKPNSGHTEEARLFIWNHTQELLKKYASK